MKFSIGASTLLLLISVSSSFVGNVHAQERQQLSPTSICVVPPLEQSRATFEQRMSQNAEQAQHSECSVSEQPKSSPVELPLTERDRLIKERFEQRIIPLQNQSGDQ